MPPTERTFGFVVHHQLHQSKAESRRASKPLMEKRRRARINHSLAQLKSLLLDGSSKKESQVRHFAMPSSIREGMRGTNHCIKGPVSAVSTCRERPCFLLLKNGFYTCLHKLGTGSGRLRPQGMKTLGTPKLEKADILEMTVRHLQGIHQGHHLPPTHAMEIRFQEGFAECAREVSRFVCSSDVDDSLRSRLLGHLASCLASMHPDIQPMDAMDADESGAARAVSHASSTSATNGSAASQPVTTSGVSMTASRVIIKQEAPDGDVATAPHYGIASHHHPCFANGDLPGLSVSSPLNLATGSRSSACSTSSSSGVSAPASPFSDSESTTSAASDDNYVAELDQHTFGVIRRAPAAMFGDPVWRPW
ncbi:hypothetical protein HPB50_017511 [Hyalomma asiaticum]|uniref:Uncharacterized protein n=1 Tax=Hyalomma asiaticum TaxID=266040 RepID=A0ACB7SIC4_HYAAI|nr:hypothetical protein HPB50_017511 [Hyalomma asiaticum]